MFGGTVWNTSSFNSLITSGPAKFKVTEKTGYMIEKEQ
jgi:hypothetical protein